MSCFRPFCQYGTIASSLRPRLGDPPREAAREARDDGGVSKAAVLLSGLNKAWYVASARVSGVRAPRWDMGRKGGREAKLLRSAGVGIRRR